MLRSVFVRMSQEYFRDKSFFWPTLIGHGPAFVYVKENSIAIFFLLRVFFPVEKIETLKKKYSLPLDMIIFTDSTVFFIDSIINYTYYSQNEFTNTQTNKQTV